MPTVGVFFGGRSSESEVSVITGLLACNLLRSGRDRVVPVYLPPEGGMVTGRLRAVEDVLARKKLVRVRLAGKTLVREGSGRAAARLDAALNCCHGGMGEDGTLAALFAWNGLPSASPALAESAVFMDKWLTKIAARGLSLPVAPAALVREGGDGGAAAEEVGYPLVVKPVRLGSSIGVSVVRAKEELSAALALAFSLDRAALLERYFPQKRDVNCAAAYLDGEVRLLVTEDKEGREISRQLVHDFNGTSGVVRADFLVVGDEVYFNELNMVPGSLAGYLFGGSLIEVRGFLEALVAEALRPVREKRIVTTGILTRGVFSGGKSCKRR